MSSVEHKTMVACNVELVSSISNGVVKIAEDLLAEGFIPENTEERMRLDGVEKQKKSAELVSVVRGRIQNQPEMFHKFVDILSKYMWLSDLVKLLLSTHASK